MTAPLTDLDARTRDELQPPCELTRGGLMRDRRARPCDNPAGFIFRTACPLCSSPSVLLICQPHIEVCVRDALVPGTCIACRRPSANWPHTVEPLR